MECQRLCNTHSPTSPDTICEWFNWRDADNPTRCWLLKNKRTKKVFDHGRNLGATGPRSCYGKYR